RGGSHRAPKTAIFRAFRSAAVCKSGGVYCQRSAKGPHHRPRSFEGRAPPHGASSKTMTSPISPARLPRLLKINLPMLVALPLGGLPFASVAQDASSSAEPAAPAQPSGTTVVATVGGETITEADLAFAAEDLGQALQQIPQDQLRAYLLTQM